MVRKKLGWISKSLIALLLLIAIATSGLLVFSYQQAVQLITHPLSDRLPLTKTPEDFGLPYEDVVVTTSDGLELKGWFIPSENGAVVMAQHGYKADRSEMLEETLMLHRHGYGVLVTSLRSHDQNPGDRIQFGKEEMEDLKAWYGFLLNRDGVSPDQIGILGNSLGGALVIQFAAQEEEIKAIMTHSAFSSLHETVDQSIQAFAGLPPFPFSTLVMFWAEWELGFPLAEINTKRWVAAISPRPILILQGGADKAISVKSGQLLYETAKEPKSFWYEPTGKHCNFDTAFPEAFEQRMIEFFDQYLL